MKSKYTLTSSHAAGFPLEDLLMVVDKLKKVLRGLYQVLYNLVGVRLGLLAVNFQTSFNASHY